MNKLTAEVARMDIGHLREIQAMPHVGLSLKEEKCLQALEIALPVLAHPGGWISCSERMPEVGSRVLIAQYEKNISTASYLQWHGAKTEKGRKPRFEDSRGIVHGVTHWQPLPPPPSTTPHVDNDGWIKWGGGDVPPVEGLVEVRWSDASKDTGNAHKFRWYHYKIISNIIAYRVIENDGREG